MSIKIRESFVHAYSVWLVRNTRNLVINNGKDFVFILFDDKDRKEYSPAEMLEYYKKLKNYTD